MEMTKKNTYAYNQVLRNYPYTHVALYHAFPFLCNARLDVQISKRDISYSYLLAAQRTHNKKLFSGMEYDSPGYLF